MAEKIITEAELQSMIKTKLQELAKSCDIETKSLSRDQLIEALRKFVSAPSHALSDTVMTDIEEKPQFTAFDLDKDVVEAPAPTLPEDWRYKLELEKTKMNLELRRQEIELKRDEMRMQMKLTELQLNANATASNSNQSFRIDTAAKMLPKLTTEHDIETYLIMFEKTARMNSWPEDKWAAILQTQLKGKGLKVFAELTDSDCKDFYKLKKSLLTAYELCPEVYRQKFRKLTKLSSETNSDFAFRLTTAFQRWLQSLNAYDNIALLREIFLMEQLMDTTSTELKLWLNETT